MAAIVRSPCGLPARRDPGALALGRPIYLFSGERRRPTRGYKVLTDMWTLLVVVVLMRTRTVTKLVLGSILVLRSNQADLPRIAEALGTWFTRKTK